MPRLLVSARTRELLRDGLAAAAQGRALDLVALEDIADDPRATVDAAFISRDISGQSTKHEVQEPLAGCYRVLRRSPALRWVHTHSTGIDRPIYGELADRGVAVTTSAGSNTDAVAQTLLAAVLALARQLPLVCAAQARRTWQPLFPDHVPPDLGGQTAVLVGWGRIARRVAPWLAMLGLEVVVVRRSAAPADGFETACYADLGHVLPRAHWLLLACPLTPVTAHLVDAAAIARLPRGARVVNVARGEVVDESALGAALAHGRLGGAYLDVFEHEPLAPDSPLWGLPNTIVAAHSAGQAAGNGARVAAIFLDHLGRWLRGEPLHTPDTGDLR